MLKTKTKTETVLCRVCDTPRCTAKVLEYQCRICYADMCKKHVGHENDGCCSYFDKFTCEQCWNIGEKHREANRLRNEQEKAEWAEYVTKCLKAREASKAKAKA